MNRTIRTIHSQTVATLAATFLISCGSSSPQGPGGGATLRVLLIGNSLTYFNDMPEMLEGLLDAAEFDGYVASVAHPNFGLEDHWTSSAALDSIRAGGWDFVGMQQGPSATEGRSSLYQWSQSFADSIRAVGAEPAMYMVWPSVARSFEFAAVANSYRTAAIQINGRLFPVGEAWVLVFERHPEIRLYGPDGFHPSREASYLAAAVMFAVLTGTDATQLDERLNVDSEVAVALRAMAQEAVERFSR